MLTKTTSSVFSKFYILKIKRLSDSKIGVWLFGILGVVKFIFNFSLIFYKINLLYIFYPNITKKLSTLLMNSSVIHTSILNLVKGYSCFVRLRGVGYKIEVLNGGLLCITLGYSHNIVLKTSFFIKIIVLKKRIIIWSYNLCKLQQFCFKLYFLKKKDVYNGKGIIQPHLQKKLKMGKISRV